MKRCGVICLLALVFILGAGFTESSRIIQVNKNGSGVILVRVLFDPARLEENQVIHNEAELKKTIYGNGVRYVISSEVTASNGWKGYLAKYHFSDITELRIFPGSLPRATLAEEGDDIRLSGWRFELVKSATPAPADDTKTEEGNKDTGGTQYTLNVIPLVSDLNDEEGGDDEFTEEPTEIGDEPEDLEFKANQKGRRYVTYLRVEGKIIKEGTTITRKSEKLPNTVTLNDEQFEVMWRNALARDTIMGEEPDFASAGLNPAEVDGYFCVTKRSKIIFK